MKRIKTMLIVLAGVFMLCGCTKSNIIRGESDLPPLSSEGIVWDQVWEDFQDLYGDEARYPFIDSVNGTVNTEEKKVRLFLLLDEEISAEEGAEYATEAIKGFNDLISDQNSDYERSSDDSYGGYVSQYEIYVMVGEEDTKMDKNCWLLEDTIPAGEYRPVNPEAAPKVTE